MPRLSTTPSAMPVLAARTPAERDLNRADNQVSAGGVADMPADVETAIGSIPAAASAPGATPANLATRRTYVSNLSDSLTTGVGSLVDANMNEAATKLAALQVRPQLGAQALSISNLDTKLILKLLEL